MVALEIREGTFVWYPAKGLGRVKAFNGDKAKVLFLSDRKSGKTESLRPNLLQPLPGDAPKGKSGDDGFAAWARKAPLTLAAAALSECDGRVGLDSDIWDKLVGRALLSSSLENWWERVQPRLAILPAYFKVYETVEGVKYALLPDVSVADVPLDASTFPAWEHWLLDSVNDLPPEPVPTSEVAEALAEWSGESIEQALSRTLLGAEWFLDSPKKSAKAALEWMDVVGSAAFRWCALHPESHQLTEQSGEILAQLSEYLKGKRKESTLFWAGKLSENPDRQRQLGRQWREQRIQSDAHGTELEKLRQEQKRQRADYEQRLEQQRLEQQRQQGVHADELKNLRASHMAEVKRERTEKERLQQQVRALDAQMTSGRMESRLEIRQGMLLAVGDAIQRAYTLGKNTEDQLENVIAALPKALREGGAEALGTVGETVKYNSKFHHSAKLISSGAKVRLTAPGVIVGDRVILKASVSTETEVC